MQSAVKHYYNINKTFVSKIGGWPTQSKFMRILLPTIIASFIFSIGFLEFIKLSETWRTITQDCECFIMLLITIGGYVKLFTIVLNHKRVEQLLSLIDYHWRVFTHSTEIKIMHDYAVTGKKITIFYAVMIYTLMSFYMVIPVTPQLLDLLVPLNKSRPYQYLFDINYSFDREAHYYLVLLHSYLAAVITMTVMVTVDTIYMMFAQHACSLFAAIGHRLENLTLGVSSLESDPLDEDMKVTYDERELVDYAWNNEDDVYRELVLILQKHQLSIQYVRLLDSSFALYSFMLLLISITITSLLGIQIISLLDRKEEMTRYVSICVGSFVHLFVLSYPGQRIMDHSANVFHKAYNMLWYRMSRRSTQLLSILFYRSFVPCKLMAGKIYVLSMSNYASMVQASVSYFTTLSSFK